jgi:preprotein translocase subunit SecY
MGGRPSATDTRELWQRVTVTLGALVIYRLGAHIPLPGVDLQVLQAIFERNADRGVDIFTGGAAGRLSLLALGITPYISASITLLLLSAAWQKLLRRSVDAYGLDRYARMGAVVLGKLCKRHRRNDPVVIHRMAGCEAQGLDRWRR